MTVDSEYTVRAIEAASDVTPYGICKEAENTLSVLVGERLVRGWSAKVKERLRGAASCTHSDGDADSAGHHRLAGYPRRGS